MILIRERLLIHASQLIAAFRLFHGCAVAAGSGDGHGRATGDPAAVLDGEEGTWPGRERWKALDSSFSISFSGFWTNEFVLVQ